MGTTLINLDYYDECANVLKDLGYILEEVREIENDMGLGNGGLGRLAACFLDSLATMSLPACGYGIRYEFGIFNQVISNGYQHETPDNWLRYGNPWEIPRPERTYKVTFGGSVSSYYDHDGKHYFQWIPTEEILAMAYDLPIPGYKNNTVNNLRLWQAKSTNDFDFEDFNAGDYLAAVENKYKSENISKVLYPNDNLTSGKELRLKQEYFFVSATIQDIVTDFKRANSEFKLLPEKTAIQLNDTHPTLAIPELMRILIDQEYLSWDEAWAITNACIAYTNHTVLSEALEKWSVNMLEKLLPRHMQIIYEINARFLNEIRRTYPFDLDRLSRMSIIEEDGDKKVKMANLAIVGSHAVNGVAALHTQILKDKIFKDFAEFEPDKFLNITNGITQRRWLKKANPFLSMIISERITDGWINDLPALKKLEPLIHDIPFMDAWKQSKWLNKLNLANYIKEKLDIVVNPESLFDIQVKRIHEYKRQLMNVLNVISIYLKIKEEKIYPTSPRTVIFAGKAAPGYYMAKLIIKFIHAVGDVINNDRDVKDYLKVVFLPNYSVSLAEKIIPAADLSEQISTAGLEASGTGNMKFALNGALTIGTLDGANIEMMEEIGKDNMYIFGLKAHEVEELKTRGYNPEAYLYQNDYLIRILNLIRTNFFSPFEAGIFQPIHDHLRYQDTYLILADYQDYVNTQERVIKDYGSKEIWIQKSILNVARIGKFSSDRSIAEYNKHIWKLHQTIV